MRFRGLKIRIWILLSLWRSHRLNSSQHKLLSSQTKENWSLHPKRTLSLRAQFSNSSQRLHQLRYLGLQILNWTNLNSGLIARGLQLMLGVRLLGLVVSHFWGNLPSKKIFWTNLCFPEGGFEGHLMQQVSQAFSEEISLELSTKVGFFQRPKITKSWGQLIVRKGSQSTHLKQAVSKSAVNQ